MVAPLIIAGAVAGAIALGSAIAGGAAAKNKVKPQWTYAEDEEFNSELRDRALGGGNSVVDLQAQKAYEANAAQAQSMAASARGSNIAVAERQIANQTAAANAATAQDAMAQRVNEQTANQAMYANELARRQQANQAYDAAKQDYYNKRAERRWRTAQSIGQAGASLAGGMAGGFGGAAGAASSGASGAMSSDMRNKENIHKANGVSKALMVIDPYEYNYDDETAAEMNTDNKKRYGVMAQQLQKNPKTKTLIIEDENGELGIDRDKAISLSLAALADINKRLSKLEKVK